MKMTKMIRKKERGKEKEKEKETKEDGTDLSLFQERWAETVRIKRRRRRPFLQGILSINL